MNIFKRSLALLLASCLTLTAQADLRGVTTGGSTTASSIATAQGGEDSVAAFATGGQASATQLSSTVTHHRVTTVATAGDSVKLPAATVGQEHYVRNDGAAAMQVFGQATETINGVASATGISQAPGMGVWYVCTTAGAWTTSPVSSFVAGADGTIGVPAFSFGGAATTGIYHSGSGALGFSATNTAVMAMSSSELRFGSAKTFGFSSNATPAVAVNDVTLARDAAATLALKNGTNAQAFRVYGTTTGPKYLSLAHDGTDGVIDVVGNNVLRLGLSGGSPGNSNVIFNTAGGVAPAYSFQMGGTTRYAFKSGANTQGSQVIITQATAPTCSSNCGTSPSVTGSDTAMIVTMGSSGVPASGWVITFNGTWAAAPSCVAQSALTTMVVGKMPIAVQTTTTTATVTTNGTAPGTSDKYAVHCIGVS
jgi:hypothetical protein